MGILPGRKGLPWLPLFVLCKGQAGWGGSQCVSTLLPAWQQWVPGLWAGCLRVLLLSFLPTSLQETCCSHSHREPDPYPAMTGTKGWNETGFLLLLYKVPPLFTTLRLFS